MKNKYNKIQKIPNIHHKTRNKRNFYVISLVVLVSHSCLTRVSLVVLVSHSCLTRSTRVAIRMYLIGKKKSAKSDQIFGK